MLTLHHEGAKTSKITKKIGHRDTETQRRNTNNAGREERVRRNAAVCDTASLCVSVSLWPIFFVLFEVFAPS